MGRVESRSQTPQQNSLVKASDSSGNIILPIDIEQSLIEWRGTEMWGRDSHEGILTLIEGHFELQQDQLIGGYFIADMNSISVTDIPKSDPIPRRNLNEHLKSEDFFYVEEYPVATFEITNTKLMKGDSLMIVGNLSIRDVTKSISFTATKTENENTIISYEASFEINRFEWNISYQGSYWERITSIIDNNFVDAEMDISVKLTGLKKEAMQN
jgi:polyisoprenoid-binding protein YceI